MKLVELIKDIGRPVAYYPELGLAIGSTSAAIFLCQFIYWAGKERSNDGWVYKTQNEIEDETGLSRREQETARLLLGKLRMLEEKLGGVPATLHYRINKDAIQDIWLGYKEVQRPARLAKREERLVKNAVYRQKKVEASEVGRQPRVAAADTLECMDLTHRYVGSGHTLNTETTSEITSQSTTENGGGPQAASRTRKPLEEERGDDTNSLVYIGNLNSISQDSALDFPDQKNNQVSVEPPQHAAAPLARPAKPTKPTEPTEPVTFPFRHTMALAIAKFGDKPPVWSIGEATAGMKRILRAYPSATPEDLADFIWRMEQTRITEDFVVTFSSCAKDYRQWVLNGKPRNGKVVKTPSYNSRTYGNGVSARYQSTMQTLEAQRRRATTIDGVEIPEYQQQSASEQPWSCDE